MSKRKKIKFTDENGITRNIRPTFDKNGFLVFNGRHYMFSWDTFFGRK